MIQFKTPGVNINELDAFPNSVVEVPTAIPVFVGYTQFAKTGTTDLTNVPTKISSFAEY
jgi:phage tail sheath protein FI